MVREGLGWKVIGPDLEILGWAAAALPRARAAIAASREAWRSGGTWFVGLDALPNTASGDIAGTPFPWAALPLDPVPLHAAQVSTIRAGYPLRERGESDAAFHFRRDRDAAHLDGLLAVGPARRRMLREPHTWILGLPLTDCGPGASPLVVWDASAPIIHAALARAYVGHPPDNWGDVDVTEAYQAARRQVFAQCRRIEVPVVPGEASLLHPMTIHGVAPWSAPPGTVDDRIIAYFRPFSPSVAEWMTLV
ncbi:MAG: hypothetical protein V4516_16520 [Pseudomonadota bacterium]